MVSVDDFDLLTDARNGSKHFSLHCSLVYFSFVPIFLLSLGSTIFSFFFVAQHIFLKDDSCCRSIRQVRIFFMVQEHFFWNKSTCEPIFLILIAVPRTFFYRFGNSSGARWLMIAGNVQAFGKRRFDAAGVLRGEGSKQKYRNLPAIWMRRVTGQIYDSK